MQRREKILLACFLATVALWQGQKLIGRMIFEPLDERDDNLTQLQFELQNKETESALVSRTANQLQRWKSESLPPDPLDAQRLYLEWLTDLGQLAGISNLKVSPGPRSSRGGVYTAVRVTLDGTATYAQLQRFLTQFHQTALLHRIESLRVDSPANTGNPELTVSLTAEGLAVADVPKRSWLFPRVTLSNAVTAEATEIAVKSSEVPLPKVPFLAWLGQERLRVEAADGLAWKVTRGVDHTTAVAHSAGTDAKLIPLRSEAETLSTNDIDALIASSPFVKPAPPIDYKPQLSDIAPQTVMRGQSLRLSPRAFGFNPAFGRPEYQLKDAPEGMEINPQTGAISWTPGAETKSGSHDFTLIISQPDAPDQILQRQVRVTLRDPNAAPLLLPSGDQVAYYGGTLEIQAAAFDSDNPPNRLTYSLGEGAPDGAAIDPETGDFQWTPSDEMEPGEYTVTIIVTDNGDPPQSGSDTFTVTLLDDAAQYTYLVAVFSESNQLEAWLYDRSQDRKTIVREGADFQVANMSGKLLKIQRNYIEFEMAKRVYRLNLGRNLRSISLIEPIRPAQNAAAVSGSPPLAE